MNRFDNIDCMIGMTEYEDNHFDLAIVDPPYGIGMASGLGGVYSNSERGKTFSKNTRHHKTAEWDNETPTLKYFKELQRISKNQIIWGGNYFTDKLPVSRGWIYWDKKITNATSPKFSDGELAWTSFDCILRKFIYDWVGFGYLNSYADRKIHPTQKPEQLYKWLLTNYAKEGDLILDTHVGSASSLIACEDMGFEYVGFELDEDYYNAAQKRLKQFRSQFKLELKHA